MKIIAKVKIGFKMIAKGEIKQAINLLKAYLNLKKTPLVMNSQPVLLQFESIKKCNLKCIMCGVNREYKGRDAGEISISKFKQALKQFPYVKSLILNGSGEPLLNKDILKVIALPRKKGILTGFHTNGLLLTPALSKKILESDLSWLNISIDSHKKETYEKIRVGSDFDKVISNIKNLVELMKQTKSKMELTLVIVVMNNNIKELPEYINFFGSLGVKNIKIQRVHIMDRFPEKKKALTVNDNKLSRHIKHKTIEMAAKIGVKLTFTTFYNKEKNKRGCDWPWLGPFINSHGDVMPCCVINSPEELTFGNIFKEDFSNIWNNEKYQEFRNDLRSNTKPDICNRMQCPYYNLSLLAN